MRQALTAIALLLSPAVLWAAEVHVDPLFGDDLTGAGGALTPFATITKALTVTAVGDTIELAPGTYAPSTGEVFPLVLPKRVTLHGAGVQQCSISGEGDFTLVEMADQCLVADIHFKRAKTAIFAHLKAYDVQYVRRCQFDNNDVAVHMLDDLHADSSFVIADSSMTANQIAVRHESVGFDFNSITLLIYGSTLRKNGKVIEPVGFGERYLGLYDSIVIDNGSDSLAAYATNVGVTSNILGDATFVGSNGNVNTAPGISSASDNDPHITALSAARDHSTIAPVWPPSGYWTGSLGWIWEATYEEIADIDGDARLVGPARDAGCDEFRSPTIHPSGPALLGSTLELRLQAEPSSLLLAIAGFGLYPTPVGSYLWVQPPYVNLGTVTTSAAGVAELVSPVPGSPGLAGVDVYLQAIDLAPTLVGSGPEWVRLLP